MKRKATPTVREPTDAEIQHAAYLLWIESGRPEGCDLYHWLAAKEMLRHRPDVNPRSRVPEAAAAAAAAVLLP